MLKKMWKVYFGFSQMTQLSVAKSFKIICIFQLQKEEFPPSNLVADQEYHDTIMSSSLCHQSQVKKNIYGLRYYSRI